LLCVVGEEGGMRRVSVVATLGVWVDDDDDLFIGGGG
jgi:hypothetical protein